MKKPYYAVSLNVPPSKEGAIRSLVPDGMPVSGTLIDILLSVARERGYDDGVSDASDISRLTLERQIRALENRVEVLSARLEDTINLMVRPKEPFPL